MKIIELTVRAKTWKLLLLLCWINEWGSEFVTRLSDSGATPNLPKSGLLLNYYQPSLEVYSFFLFWSILWTGTDCLLFYSEERIWVYSVQIIRLWQKVPPSQSLPQKEYYSKKKEKRLETLARQRNKLITTTNYIWNCAAIGKPSGRSSPGREEIDAIRWRIRLR